MNALKKHLPGAHQCTINNDTNINKTRCCYVTYNLVEIF